MLFHLSGLVLHFFKWKKILLGKLITECLSLPVSDSQPVEDGVALEHRVEDSQKGT